MRILVTGATGFIGKNLSARLLNEGHHLTVLTRNPGKARGAFPENTLFVKADLLRDIPDFSGLPPHDAVFHLAGEPIASGRWTGEKKETIWKSRVLGTQNLLDGLLSGRNQVPRILISASGVGYYGDRGDEILTEDSGPGKGFLADLCVAWEKAALSRANPHFRTLVLRTGMVLGRGGALEKMIPIFQRGGGAVFGSGRQWLSWIHISDLVSLYVAALTHEWDGAINAVAPTPVSHREFAHALARALRRKVFLRIPGFVLRMGLGEMSQALLYSQRAIPAGAQNAGFHFQFPELDGALAAVLRPAIVSSSARL